MSYFLLSLDDYSFGEFQKRHLILNGSPMINNLKQLEQEISKFNKQTIILADLESESEELEHLILVIRDQAPTTKILYVVRENGKVDINKHQVSHGGGDAYIFSAVDEDGLTSMLNSLGGEPDKTSRDALFLEKMKNSKESQELDALFSQVIVPQNSKIRLQSSNTLTNFNNLAAELDVSTKDQDISLESLSEIELTSNESLPEIPMEDQGIDLDLDAGIDISLEDSSMDDVGQNQSQDEGMSLDLSGGEEIELADAKTSQIELGGETNLGELDLSLSENGTLDEGLGLGDLDFSGSLDLGEVDELKLDEPSSIDLNLSLSDSSQGEGNSDLSDDAKEKLKEIDAILDLDASQSFNVGHLELSPGEDLGVSNNQDANLDEPLVSSDLNLDNIDLSASEEEITEMQAAPKVAKLVDKKLDSKKHTNEDSEVSKDFKEISMAYSGEMERTQATISNLRSDREELLHKIQLLEEDKLLNNRQVLTLRAELDEKKIELMITRKKNNEEISDLKDRMKLFDERKMLYEEKIKVLQVELDKASQRNKLDLKKIQLNERELEQKLELLKSDSETQIRNRDLKILELKRKIDAMEFDMESISSQEKRSVESRYELEDKLEKAIKTLRGAITVLEDDSDKGIALETLKKNIDM